MTFHDVVLLVLCLVVLLLGLAKLGASIHLGERRKEPRHEVPDDVCCAVHLPAYTVWARCDTKGVPSGWLLVYMGDDIHMMWTAAQHDYPLATFDLLVLPNGDVPEGEQ